MARMVNVAELKDSVSELLDAALQGEDVTICRRNVPVARLTALRILKNRTTLGFAPGLVIGDIDGPAISDDDWEMLRP
jgi:prevent-host-death family protein